MYFHASPIEGIKILKPQISEHGVPLIYFSKKRENVLVYLSNAIEKYCKETVKPNGNWGDEMRISKLPSLAAWEKARERLAELDEAIAKKESGGEKWLKTTKTSLVTT